ncbi:hypothetical protein FQA39_LY04561 [Lamprigera yunnana]|nr:hypothetical protein FQA39_LY04561 [Lamprigera yunnana]
MLRLERSHDASIVLKKKGDQMSLTSVTAHHTRKAASTLCRGWLLAMPGWQSQRGKADFGLPSTPRHSFAFSRKMSAEEDILVALGAFIIIIENSEKVCKQRKRRFWVRPSLQSRRKYGTSELMKDLLLDDADSMTKYCASATTEPYAFEISGYLLSKNLERDTIQQFLIYGIQVEEEPVAIERYKTFTSDNYLFN